MESHAFTLLSLSALFGVADYTMTRIILKGSIFEKFRNLIKYSDYTTIKQLFSCHLCLGAQVSLWFISFPLHYFASSPFNYFLSSKLTVFGDIIFNVGSWFLFAMIITGIHYVLWAITVDYPTQPSQPINITIDGQIKNPDAKKPDEVFLFEERNYNNGKITLEEFIMLVFYVHYSYGNINCNMERPYQIRLAVDSFIKGKIMRAMNLIGFGKIPDRIHETLLKKLFRVIDEQIDNFKFQGTPIGSQEWVSEVKDAYEQNEIAQVDFI